jgi:hypothetical protein
VTIVKDAFLEAYAELSPADGPRLWDRAEAARYLGVSTRQVDLLRKHHALPTRWVGDSPRFDPGELDEWSRCRTGSSQGR